MSCNVFTGCCPRMRTMQLLQYWRYEYAMACIGQQVYHRGCFGSIEGIDTTNGLDIQVYGTVRDSSKTKSFQMSLLDVAMAIRTAQTAKRSKKKGISDPASNLYPLPVEKTNIAGIVDKMVQFMALVPSMSLPTRQLQQETNYMTLAVVIPRNGPSLFLPSILPRK